MKLPMVLLVLLLVLIPTGLATTASIGNARMVLRTDVVEGRTTTIDKTIKVNNVNSVPVNITLNIQGDLTGMVDIYDKNFILQPGESKDANFRISLNYGGYYEGRMGVSFKPTDGSQGVGLSSTIIVIATGPKNPNPDIKPVNITSFNQTVNNETGNGVTIGNNKSNNQNSSPNNPSNQSGMNPPTGGVIIPISKRIVPLVVGMIIILTLIAAGMAIYLTLTKR